MPSISPYDSNYFESNIDASDLQAVISLRNIKSLTLESIGKLNALGVFTVSDLIRYKPIHDAKFLLALDSGEIVHDYNYSHLADNTSKSLKELLESECVELRSVSIDDNIILKSNLAINTIRGLANYTVYTEALELIEKSNNVFNEAPSAPNELIPKLKGSVHSFARYVSYIRESTVKLSSTIFAYDDYTKNVADSLLQELLIPQEIKPGNTVIPQLIKIHLGYIAEFKQKWTFVNTQLGEIIHSLALAPGESRNITIIDWKRSQITSKKEDTGVSEQLTSDLMHRRALDEVTTATAREHVQGRTDVEGGTIGGSLAVTSGASANAGAAGKGKTDALGVPADATAAAGAAGSAGAGMVVSGGYAKGTVTSSNDGERTVTGNLSQDIMDTVSQKASNLRSLWSVVVAEDNQTENKQINTRNVTNYNHSHALTIQYYEVLHRYRAETALSNAVPILYFPYHPLKFNIELIVKYWSILKNYLDKENELVKKMEPVVAYFNSGNAIYNTTDDIILKKLGVRIDISNEVSESDKNAIISSLNIPSNIRPELIIPNVVSSTVVVSQIINRSIIEYSSDTAAPAVTTPIHLDRIIFNFPTPIILDFYIKLTFESQGKEVIKELNINSIKTINGVAEYQLPLEYVNIIDKKRPSNQLVNEIVNYFNSHRYFFTRVLLQSVENEQLIDLIQGIVITANGHGIYLTDFIDFAPIGITDNTIIFKLKQLITDPKPVTEKEIFRIEHFMNKDKKPLLQTDAAATLKKIFSYYSEIIDLPNSTNIKNKPVSDDIYLPTSGIFAEAILGRSNASEKIDITRFYNWQDSPIPHLAPEIAPADPNVDLNKGPLNTTSNIPGSVLNIINPPSLPDPTGLAASLQAVQNGNMFRDMSKSETLLGVLTNLSNFSTELAKQASTMADDAQKSTLNAANDIAKSVLNALPAGNNESTGTGSGTGNNNNGDESTTTTPAKVAGTATEKGAAVNLLEQAEKDGSLSKEDAGKSKVLTAGGTLTESIGGGGVNPRNPASVIPTLFGNIGPDGDSSYSKSPVAKRKKEIDEKLSKAKIPIDITNEKYLKALIKEAGGTDVFATIRTPKLLQFFIVKGGAEGFLPKDIESENADDKRVPTKSTGGAMIDGIWDYNDLLIVFDAMGNLFNSTILRRPIFLPPEPKYKFRGFRTNPPDLVYNSWNNKEVFIYYNNSYTISYVGLGIKDGYRNVGAKPHITVDIHKMEASDGCIFLYDKSREGNDLKNEREVSDYEPDLIKKILTLLKVSDSKKLKSTIIGKMNMLEIK